MKNILLIEDDKTISMTISYLLKDNGYNVTSVFTINEAEEKLKEKTFNLILLDIQLPDGNGFDMCKYIKDNYETPVIIITAKNEDEDISRGFKQNADDYIVKPFKTMELLSRIKARETKDTHIINYNNIKIDKQNYKVYKNDVSIDLKLLEYKIILVLFENINKILTREQILSSIWENNESFVNDNTLSVYIKRIREKLEDENIIKTIRGIGYKVGE